ncbi:MAG: hypothetical protein MI810_04760 [Flavobacteriales bacterium]|nr:hypothetical protein [Flavobacteriales bacterium]
MKNVINILLIAYCLCPLSINAQIPAVDVAELTLKVGTMQTEELYYGFAEGDQIVFNFEELKGKELKEIEIVELPTNSKFMDFKSTSISDKKINVTQTAVYKFSFKNTAVKGRICKVKIQRIPKSEDLISFNTNWEWKTLYDTTWVPYTEDSIVGYDTTRIPYTKRELIKTEQVEELIMDKTQKVHSFWNENSSYTYLRIDLPSNKKETYQEEKVISWAYWIGVGKEASEAYAKNVSAIGNVATEAAFVFGTPLAGIAVGALTELLLPKTGEDVEYAFINDYQNVQAFLSKNAYYQFDKGKGIAAYGKNSNKLQGTFYIGLHNDNQTVGIDVNVKIVVIKEIKTYADVQHVKTKITPQKVTLNKRRAVVNTTKIRINSK